MPGTTEGQHRPFSHKGYGREQLVDLQASPVPRQALTIHSQGDVAQRGVRRGPRPSQGTPARPGSVAETFFQARGMGRAVGTRDEGPAGPGPAPPAGSRRGDGRKGAPLGTAQGSPRPPSPAAPQAAPGDPTPTPPDRPPRPTGGYLWALPSS